MSEKFQTDPDPPSELFANAVCNAGTPAATCELCGREHYDALGQNMDEGELESYEAKHKDNPEKYVPNDGGVSIGHINGVQVVWGCPCNKLARYEKFIWSHRYLIAKYLRDRIQEQIAKVELDIEQCALPQEILPEEMPKPKRKFQFP